MKRSVFIRIMAVLLVVCLAVPTTLSAAAFGQSGSRTSWFQNQWESMIEQITGWFRPEGNNEIVPTEATTATTEATTAPTEATAAPTEAATEPAVDPTEETETPEHQVLESVDSQVVHPEMLRAATYKTVAPEAGKTVKTFPITMYNYDERINEATHHAELAALAADQKLTQWDGIYFTDGSPKEEGYVEFSKATGMVDPNFDTNGKAQIAIGQYYIYSVSAGAFVSQNLLGTGLTTKKDSVDATKWTVTKEENSDNYTIKIDNKYLNVKSSAKLSSSSMPLQLHKRTECDDANALMISNGNYDLYHKSGSSFKGSSSDKKERADFYLIEASKISEFKPAEEVYNQKAVAYASHNWWTGKIPQNDGPFNDPTQGIVAGDRVFSGMAKPELDRNGNIQFNYPQGGIFDDNQTVKDIYDDVQMPFQYNSADNTYTFDSAKDSAHFAKDPAPHTKLESFGGPQRNGFATSGNDKGYGWYPFNKEQVIDGEKATDYHFGAKMTVPFSMTKNGRMKENDESSAPINFKFTGDDDVWVFIDGKLVLDLGGIHNAVDGELDFANNTWKITAAENKATEDAVNPTTIPMQGKIFNEGTADGVLKQNRATFAAQSTHQLTIFYLERGKGSSNCKISFNLPFFDTLTVVKSAGQKKTTQDGQVTTEPLTPAELKQVKDVKFGFTLYKKTTEGTFKPVSNAAFNVLNQDKQVIDSRTTDKDGHFTLKHQQAAQFRTQFNGIDGTTYYVVEDKTPGFVDPQYHFSVVSSGNFTVADTTLNPENDKDLIQNTQSLESSKVHVIDSEESEGSVIIACVNYLNNDLGDPSVNATDKKIVMDYGLDVMIDPMIGNTYKGENYRLYGIGGETYTPNMENAPDTDPNAKTVALKFGTATIENGKIRYHLTKPLTDVEVLTYAVAVDRSAESYNPDEHACSTAKIYIIPATSMYYEESFDGLVQLSDGWTTVGGDSKTATQEPGVVGTPYDSPYGSDVYYKKSSGDSCGSHSYADVSHASAKFTYTFTGTGTTFFARTSQNSAYMRVRITGSNGTNDIYYRDTRYDSKQADGTSSAVTGTLYNIPVFTWEGEYGTYTVEVSLANAEKAKGYGNEFYLDGIRVMNPLDPMSSSLGIAESAYATDGEAGMTYVTLRDKMLDGATGLDENGNPVWKPNEGFVSFTDTNGKLETASEYKSIGPKEELYLYNNQNVSFALKNWAPEMNKLYLGMKAPKGDAQVRIGTKLYNVNNTVDCYYLLQPGDYNIEQTADGERRVVVNIQGVSGLISLTNIKVTGTPNFDIVGNSTNEVVPAPPETDVPVPEDQVVPAPNAAVIAPVVEETTAPETTVTEPAAEETTAPETTVTEPVAEETTAPETTATEPVVEETTAPDTAAEQVTEEASAPNAEVHETTNP